MSDAHTVTARSFAQTYCSDWSAVRFLLESVPSKDCYPDATRLRVDTCMVSSIRWSASSEISWSTYLDQSVCQWLLGSCQ